MIIQETKSLRTTHIALCLQPPGKLEPDRLETDIIVTKHVQVDFYRIWDLSRLILVNST